MTESEQPRKPVIVLFLRSGRFAGAVFSGDRVLHHTTSTRYTVRKGQGKAQSAQDGQRRPQSMGAQLRRQGERQLDEDVAAALGEWREAIREAALIFVSVPKTMKKSLFENGGEHCLQRDDPRIRRVPLDLGRPSFENVCLIHAVLTTVSLRERIAMDDLDDDTKEDLVESEKKEETVKAAVIEKKPPVIEAIPLSPLHVAAQNGDVGAIRLILESDDDDNNDDNQDNIAEGSSSLMIEAASPGSGRRNTHDTAALRCRILLLPVVRRHYWHYHSSGRSRNGRRVRSPVAGTGARRSLRGGRPRPRPLLFGDAGRGAGRLSHGAGDAGRRLLRLGRRCQGWSAPDTG